MNVEPVTTKKNGAVSEKPYCVGNKFNLTMKKNLFPSAPPVPFSIYDRTSHGFLDDGIGCDCQFIEIYNNSSGLEL